MRAFKKNRVTTPSGTPTGSDREGQTDALLEAGRPLSDTLAATPSTVEVLGDNVASCSSGSQQQQHPKGLADVLRAAYSVKVAQAHVERRNQEHSQAAKTRFWLSGKLMMAAVSDRYGPESWQADLVRKLQSQEVQIALICFLLLDVIFIFAELFIEAEYPTCRTMSHRAVSCCAASEGRQLGGAFHVHDEKSALLAHQIGFFPECPSPLVAAPAANGLQCLEGDQQWAHVMHEALTVGSLCILGVFAVELGLLLSALGSLFLRSWAYVLDLVIISSSLTIMLYVYWARAHARATGDVVGLEGLQGIIMFARCWRFVRVGHGIALSMHDLVHASHVQLQHKIEGMRQALHVMEANARMEGRPGAKNSDPEMEKVHDLLRQVSSHYGGGGTGR